MFKKRLKHKRLTSNQVGHKYGFRSGLEEQIADELRGLRVLYEFEETKLKDTKPQKIQTYTPDFYLPKQKIILETKGLRMTEDRQKMKRITEQHSDKDMR